MKILVAGGTGYLGHYVLKEFKNRGFAVRALVRNQSKHPELQLYCDEIFEGQVTERQTLRGVCEGIDMVFSCVGITRQKDGFTYMDVDYQGNQNLLNEALRSNVKKFVYVSVFNAEKFHNLQIVEAKRKFEMALIQSGINYSILYPNGYFSDMKEFFSMARKGRGYAFGNGGFRINPIHGADLAEACAQALSGHERRIVIGGPEVLTHNEILALAFQILDKPVKVTYVPVWICNLLSKCLPKIVPKSRSGPIEFLLTVLSHDMIAPAHGHRTLKSYFEELRNAL